MARMSNLLEEVRNIEEGFASDAQRRAAFASGYKEKGKKKKEDIDEGMKYTHVAVDKEGLVIGFASDEKDAKDMAKRNDGKVVKLKKPMSDKKGDMMINRPFKEEVDIQEDGHTDVASAVRQCKTVVEDATQMMSKLQGMSPEDSLPTWWTNKLAVASNSMNKMRDYLLVPSVSEEVELDEAIPKSTMYGVVVKGKYIAKGSKEDMLKLAKKTGGQLMNAPSKKVGDSAGKAEEVELDEGKMKELAMYIDDIASEMAKDKMMKPFASKFKADAMKSMNPRKSLEKVLPDYIAGKEIAKLLNMGMGEEKLNEILPLLVRAAPAAAKAVSKINPSTIGSTAATVATAAQKAKDYVSKKAKAVKKRITGEDVEVIEGYFPERKSSTGYDLYHNDFSSAMQHAYDHAKKKFGITIDKSEIDDKVATGPRKPTKGKTNSYRLKGDKGTVQIQVYNMGNKFELNVYKESIDEVKKKPVSQMTPKEKAADAARRKEYKDYQKSKREEVKSEAIDPADFDISATDKDVENASKNIILQLRKVITLRGQKPVEFANGKKEKVHPNVATAALSMHQKLRRTDEKDAFQQKIAKSYRDLLNAVKEK